MMFAGWMRRCASLMAMRRISWIDQQIINDVLSEDGTSLFLRRDIGAMTNDGDHGEGELDQ
jgi:hypothetical protein